MSSFIEEVISTLKTIVIAFIIGLIVSNFIISNAVVPTGSMEKTVQEKGMIIR